MKIFKPIFTILIFIFVVIVLLKFSIIEVWRSEDYASTYSIIGDDGRKMIISILPDNKALFYYIDNAGLEEIVLSDMHGEYGIHLFGKVWRVSGPNTGIGISTYDSNFKPVNMEIEVLESVLISGNKSSFPDEGEIFYSIMQFGESKINFSKMWLNSDNDLEKTINNIVLQYNIQY